MTPALEIAIDAHRRGWSVMPVEPGKKPLERWRRFQKELPHSKQIDFWARKWPSANWGVITGAFSGLFIVEADTEDAMRWMEETVGIVGPVAQSSKRYKRHYYFKHPGWEVKTCCGLMRDGLDVRGEGGYAVLPGSIHKSGVMYSWLVRPDEAPLPDAPQLLLDLLPRRQDEKPILAPVVPLSTFDTRLEKWAKVVLKKRCEIVAQAPAGTVHQTLLRNTLFVAGFIPYGLLDAGQVRAAFFDAVSMRAQDQRHALKTIDHSIQRGIARPSELPQWAR